MKSFTDIEQSKKLAKILPIESADMYYFVADSLEKQEINYAIRCGTPIVKTDIPSWNLAALLEFLDYPQLSKDKLGSGKVGWMVSVYPNNCRYDSCWHDNPVDACYKLILKLHELKML